MKAGFAHLFYHLMAHTLVFYDAMVSKQLSLKKLSNQPYAFL